MKKPPQKVAYLKAEIPSFQKFSFYCPTAQMAEFMFPDVAYRATVYRTGKQNKVLVCESARARVR